MISKHNIIIAEDISFPIDEGIKKFSFQFFCYSGKMQNTTFMARYFKGSQGVYDLPSSKLFLSWQLRKKIKEISPSHIIYVPFSSTTFFSFLRLFVLSLYSHRAKKIIISLQRRKHNGLGRIFIKLFKPELLITFSKKEEDYYHKLGIKTYVSNVGVDIDRYNAVELAHKNALRKKYQIPADAKLAVHVGHINQNRNVHMLEALFSAGYKVLIVGSTSTFTDVQLKDELEKKGCIVYNQFIENIEEIYQMADVYVFPVLSRVSAIEFPLSVLEAMSCNLPVFITPFGALQTFFNESENVKFFDTENELVSKVSEYDLSKPCTNRDLILNSFTWDEVFSKIIKEAESL